MTAEKLPTYGPATDWAELRAKPVDAAVQILNRKSQPNEAVQESLTTKLTGAAR